MNTDQTLGELLPELPPFSEENYSAGYRRIRKRMHRYDPERLIIQIARHINSGVDPTDVLRRQPWLGMLLIKWILVDRAFDKPKRPAPESNTDWHLMQAMRCLGLQTRMPDDYEHFLLFFRAMAQQQFHYQRAFSPASFHRQLLLFGNLAPNHRLRRQFADSTGLELPEFLELAIALMVLMVTKPRKPLQPRSFAIVQIPEAEAKGRLLLNAFGADLKELRARLLPTEGARRLAQEYYELSPFVSLPLLRLKDSYWAWYPELVYRRLEHFVHDHLRAPDPQGFMQSFGKIFEEHVGSLIARTKLPTATEAEINRLRKHQGQPVDFVITEGDAHILIDAKGIVDSNRVMTTPRGDILRDSLKGSALKAIGQGCSVASWLQTATGLPTALTPRPRTYLIVVTYKELHLGDGPTFRDMAAKTDVEELYQQAGSNPPLPLENVQFMSVEDFDLLCHAVAASRIRFAEALDQAKAAAVDPRSRKFEFRQHMRTWPFFDQVRKHLDASFMALMDTYAAKYGGT